jgi:hypothetical protein
VWVERKKSRTRDGGPAQRAEQEKSIVSKILLFLTDKKYWYGHLVTVILTKEFILQHRRLMARHM